MLEIAGVLLARSARRHLEDLPELLEDSLAAVALEEAKVPMIVKKETWVLLEEVKVPTILDMPLPQQCVHVRTHADCNP